jgi:integrase
VALDLIALRNVLRAAEDAGHLDEIPRFPKVAKVAPPRRPLISPEQFESILTACTARKEDDSPVTKNGEQLRDYLRFLAFTGAREQEALRTSGRTWISNAQGCSSERRKTSRPQHSPSARAEPRRIPGLAWLTSTLTGGLLREIHARRAPDTSFPFPSPKGSKRCSCKDFTRIFEGSTNFCRSTDLRFHHLRVYFISYAVMNGIDFMTIAKWVGHRDGVCSSAKFTGTLQTSTAKRWLRGSH